MTDKPRKDENDMVYVLSEYKYPTTTFMAVGRTFEGVREYARERFNLSLSGWIQDSPRIWVKSVFTGTYYIIGTTLVDGPLKAEPNLEPVKIVLRTLKEFVDEASKVVADAEKEA